MDAWRTPRDPFVQYLLDLPCDSPDQQGDCPTSSSSQDTPPSHLFQADMSHPEAAPLPPPVRHQGGDRKRRRRETEVSSRLGRVGILLPSDWALAGDTSTDPHHDKCVEDVVDALVSYQVKCTLRACLRILQDGLSLLSGRCLAVSVAPILDALRTDNGVMVEAMANNLSSIRPLQVRAARSLSRLASHMASVHAIHSGYTSCGQSCKAVRTTSLSLCHDLAPGVQGQGTSFHCLKAACRKWDSIATLVFACLSSSPLYRCQGGPLTGMWQGLMRCCADVLEEENQELTLAFGFRQERNTGDSVVALEEKGCGKRMSSLQHTTRQVARALLQERMQVESHLAKLFLYQCQVSQALRFLEVGDDDAAKIQLNGLCSSLQRDEKEQRKDDKSHHNQQNSLSKYPNPSITKELLTSLSQVLLGSETVLSSKGQSPFGDDDDLLRGQPASCLSPPAGPLSQDPSKRWQEGCTGDSGSTSGPWVWAGGPDITTSPAAGMEGDQRYSPQSVTEIFAAIGIEQDPMMDKWGMGDSGGPTLSVGLMEELENVLATRTLPQEQNKALPGEPLVVPIPEPVPEVPKFTPPLPFHSTTSPSPAPMSGFPQSSLLADTTFLAALRSRADRDLSLSHHVTEEGTNESDMMVDSEPKK